MEEHNQDGEQPEVQEGEYLRIGPGAAAFQLQPGWTAPDNEPPIKRRNSNPVSLDMLPRVSRSSRSTRFRPQLTLGLGSVALIALLALIAAVLHATEPASSPTASTTATSTSPSADGGSYADGAAVLTALSAAGKPCASPSPVANPTAAGATSMIDCFSSQAAGSAESDSVVVVFDDHADAQAFAQKMLSLVPADTDPATEVVGVNWVVNTGPVYGIEVLDALGGSISVADPDPGPGSGPVSSPTAAGSAPTPQPTTATTQAPLPAQTVTYSCTGHAGDGVNITYGAEGSNSSAHHLPFNDTEPLNTNAGYFDVTAQLQGGGTVTCSTVVNWTDTSGDAQSVTQSGTASGGYNIASAEVCESFEGDWQAC